MKIGFTYDCFEEYLSQGFDANDCAEFDSLETINAIADTLRLLGHEVVKIGNVKQLINLIAKGERWDIVFNIAEGIKGSSRESQVPNILEIYDIPYVFSDSVVMAIALNKGMTKRLVRDYCVPTANFVIVEDLKSLSEVSQKLKYPLFVKPNLEGSSKGIESNAVVYSLKELKDVCEHLFNSYKQSIIIEEFLSGREFTVGIIGTGCDAKVLGVMEIEFRKQDNDLCYSRKVKANYKDHVTYALAEDEEAILAAEYALKIWQMLGCRDAGRIDFRSNSQNIPYFLEINPLAGLMIDDSDLPILSRKVGVQYKELIENILKSAVSRYPGLVKKHEVISTI
jgi:D-alanine-D-alanine ligase